MSRSCCCFGHRFVYTDINARLEKELIKLVETKDVNIFYTGGMGEFDNLYSSAVRTLKHSYTDIKLILVKPYFTNDLNTDKDFYTASYDSVIIPEELIGVHYKGAIKQRNRWMVDNSDYLIAYIILNTDKK